MAVKCPQQHNAPRENASTQATNPSHTGGTGPLLTDFQIEQSRRHSVLLWPEDDTGTSRQMSEAGLLNKADVTLRLPEDVEDIGVYLQTLEPGNDPIKEDIKRDPNRLETVKYDAATQEHMTEEQRQSQFTKRGEDEAASTLKECKHMGSSDERTREAILAVLQQKGSGQVTTLLQDILRLADDVKRKRHALSGNTCN